MLVPVEMVYRPPAEWSKPFGALGDFLRFGWMPARRCLAMPLDFIATQRGKFPLLLTANARPYSRKVRKIDECRAGQAITLP